MAIAILMYHQIVQPPARGTAFRSLCVAPRAFRRQMTWMRRLGYRGLSMRELMPYLRGERTGKVFGITFDDGYRNVYDHALPVLCELGFTATSYCVANQIDGGNLWDREKGIAFSPLMNVAEMLRWTQLGHEIGSHTLDHVPLGECSWEQALPQIVDSKTVLEGLLGVPVTAFCYPYGSCAPEHRQLVRQAGYESATLVRRGRASASDDPFGLPRVTISRSTGWLRFLQKCFTGYEASRASVGRQ
jgi:peptidoglycan/xylan/chitin deacetylase (PgdA/CDA1 family)